MQKIRKRFDGEQEKSMVPIDRLPDEILVHILSFMSTGDCVRSSILGKRWRFLWARVSNLQFYSGEHQTLTSFSNFVNRFVFTHKGQNINKIHFDNEHMKGSGYEFEIESLIKAAIACNVQAISIDSDYKLMLPQCIFTCKTIVDLALCNFDKNNIPMIGTTVYLPALKKLSLDGVIYESEKSIMHLLSGCPVLEKLTIIKLDVNVVCFCVSSPSLIWLDLETQYNENEENDAVFEVKLDTPALKYLRLRDEMSRDISAGMLASLTEADVVIDALTEMDVLYSRSILDFVGKLNNVGYLKLTTGLMQVHHSAFSDLTTEFRSLTKLELAGDWRFVANFLENSDNLEVLSFDMHEGDNLQFWIEPKQVPVCLTYHLGTVTFSNFQCSEPEFNMVSYILRNAKVLKMMKIYALSGNYCDSIDDLKKKYEALKRISLFERASEACQLDFV